MAVPISPMALENVLRPWLGSLFLSSNPTLPNLARLLQSYAPYKQSLEDLRDDVESFLVTNISGYTRGTMQVLNDHYRTQRLNAGNIRWMTDEVMGVLFDCLTPFSANFIRLNDYSLRVQSLSALRVLYQKYSSFYSPEELNMMITFIKRTYPPENYREWLFV